jgi:ribosome-binding factor A
MATTARINPHRDRRTEDLIKEMASKFLSIESNRTSLVTVTNINLYNRGKNVTIFFTVLPEDKEHAVLDFTKRKRAEFREYMKENSRLPIIPFVDFEIDLGEKNRQNVDRLI